MTSEVYISVDIETDGPIPGPYSMISLGAVAFDGRTDRDFGRFSINLERLEGAGQHPDTMEFWGKNRTAYEAATKDQVPPAEAMQAFAQWVKEVSGTAKPVFVAYPAGFDFMFVYWYLIKFIGHSPFSFSALDMKSYASSLLAKPYKECTKRNFPKHWMRNLPKHDHTVVNDALGQGMIFVRMLNDSIENRDFIDQCGNF